MVRRNRANFKSPELHSPPNCFGHGAQARDKIGKYFRENRLLAVALGELRRIVDLNHDGIRAGGDSRESHLRHEIAQADPVSRVNHDG